ncbi:MAG TPA: heme-binding protein [Burkholderiales bacterium]|nr:heme-binding protein [Burkholderiales bacterium]
MTAAAVETGMPDFVSTYRLTHEASLKMIQAGIAKADELGAKVALAVVDQSCQLIALVKMDGAKFFAPRTTIKKAITSASQRRPTGYAAEKDVLSMQIRMDGDFTNVPGGFPVVVAGQVIGAVAAGGAKIEEDVIVAEAALAALELAEIEDEGPDENAAASGRQPAQAPTPR